MLTFQRRLSLEVAVENGHVDIVRDLVEAGARVTEKAEQIANQNGIEVLIRALHGQDDS